MRSSSHVLQGPRPTPLTISRSSAKITKIKQRAPPPIVVYLRSPKIIHVRPEEFMSLVQQLTGNHPKISASSATRNIEGQNKFYGEEFTSRVNEVSKRMSSSGFDHHDYSSGYSLDIHMC
ncbi:hypothetical protein L484_006437 [Morus notabilis]|uniref:VQ domain-containing protein n=1 Tax=Morus notabilis TaxID=981085 RepID=W9STZ0_9ROSA|nr:nuclear speckle RNA-binding protein B [Morus notabilis]EXC26386.1 hypothetical protein L484_006437 [Morus notabilis]